MFNPYKEIITDEQFNKLLELKALDETKLRNFIIKEKFRILRQSYKSTECFEIIQKEYSYITIETIRRAAYGHRGNKKS